MVGVNVVGVNVHDEDGEGKAGEEGRLKDGRREGDAEFRAIGCEDEGVDWVGFWRGGRF